MGRTIVASDIHGQSRLLENVLEHSGYDQTKDTLVIAGDTCDIGNRTMEIHDKLEELGAKELLGNHEISHLCQIRISPYDYALDPDYVHFLALGIDQGSFTMAYAVDGVLITHAGISKRLAIKGVTQNGLEDSFLSVHHHSGTLTAEVTANLLNDRLKHNIRIDKRGYEQYLDVKSDPMWTDWFYPFWFRPYEYADQGPRDMVGFYNGFKQVVGHTPWGAFDSSQQKRITADGVTMVDPYARKYWGNKGYCRYAVIENGEVELQWVKEAA